MLGFGDALVPFRSYDISYISNWFRMQLRRGALKRIKRFMVLAAMLGMVLIFAVPVVAAEVSQNAGEGVGQNSDMASESGDAGQTFDAAGSGGNSNQCAGVSGNGNTGSTRPATDVIQFDSQADDFQFQNGGSARVLQFGSKAGDFAFDGGNPSLTVSGNSTTTCGQQGNQGAATG